MKEENKMRRERKAMTHTLTTPTSITPPARGDTFLLVVGDVILWVSNLATSAKSWGQTFNNS